MSWDAVDTVQTLEDALQSIRARALSLYEAQLARAHAIRPDALLGLATSAAGALNTIGGEDGYDEDRQRYCVICAEPVEPHDAEGFAPTHEECRR